MAHIEKKLGKRGLSYRFIVSAGFDCNGKRIFHKKTWKPPPNMTEKQADKAANREAVIFEQSIAQVILRTTSRLLQSMRNMFWI